jgi:transglutaminase-like putative cysteine protease
MKFPSYLVCLMLLIVGLLFVAAPAALAGESDWKPLDKADLDLKAPVVEKDADAEAIFWEVRVDDDKDDMVISNYIRIKVFTERGRESQSKVEIQFGEIFGRDVQVKDIAARTVKPDGTIVELKKEDIFERTTVKLSGLKLKVKSFALPSVEPGSIIEYRWREVFVFNTSHAGYVRLPFQRDIPIQNVSYYVKPISNPRFPYAMRYQTFHMGKAEFVKDKNGFHRMTQTNVPAFHEEPRMPPEDELRQWVLIYYSLDRKLVPATFWKEYGKERYDEFKSSMKVSEEVRKAAADAVGDATTPEQKLERIFEFCRTKIKNLTDDASGLTPDERLKLKSNKSAAETLRRGGGTGTDIDMLFAALATAAGFEARVAFSADRSDIFFDPTFADDYFIHTYDIAVRVGDQWRFYDPASTYVPYSMLRWQEEGQKALLSDPKEPTFVETPLSPPEKSVQKRTATLRMSEDGTLEGDVRIEYTGHFAAEMKEYYDDDTLAEREQALRDHLKQQMSTAEISNIRIENVTDPAKPFVHAYHVRVPGYAERTGKRLFLQPAFFQYGLGPLFATSERKHPIYFHYPWSEDDTVTIEMPAGFALDSPDKPAPFGSGNLTRYKVEMMVKNGRQLIYKRSFFFGGEGSIYIPTTSYAPLKQYFDKLNKSDNHKITLKQGAEAAAAPPK